MAETADTINTTTSPPQPESEGSPTVSTMADPTSQESPSKDTDLTAAKGSESEKKPGGISIRIWPPTQKTRDAVLNRLIETLSTESILSKRYGTVKSDEATTVAKSIEEEAYGVASNAVSGDDNGIKILELYSKEISKRMLESVKARSDNAAGSVGNGTESVEDASEVSKDDTPSVSEEDKSEP